jgi:hypothetical protein
MMMHVATDFEGLWTLKRSIDDRHSDQMGDFQGTATFASATDGALTYYETGQMRFGAGAQVFNAERRYQWQFENEQVAVFFHDGSPFHHFTPTGQGAGTTHLCGDDLYDVTYDFREWPVWTATWSVQGPRKNYTSVSTYAPDCGRKHLASAALLGH